jgi:hypothetical protein
VPETAAVEPEEATAAPEAAAAETEPAATEPATTEPAATETATAEPEAPAEPAAAEAPVVPEPAIEPEVVTTEVAAAGTGTDAAAAVEVTMPEPEPEPAPEPVVPQGEVIAEQIVATAWEVALPFATEMVEASGRSFPMIATVEPGAGEDSVNSWIREGVVIFAVNDEWVTSEDDIRSLIESTSELGENDFLSASVRIRPNGATQFEHVTLNIPAMRVVDLANGARFRATFEDNRWKSRVEVVPDLPGNELQVGDEIVSENVTAQGVRYSQSVEAFAELLARRKVPMADFSVMRNGTVVPSVKMPLATE